MPHGGRHLMIFNPLSSQDRSRSKSRGLQSWKQTGNLLLFLLLSVKTFCPSMHLKITILVYVTWWWAFIHWRSRGASEWMVPCLLCQIFPKILSIKSDIIPSRQRRTFFFLFASEKKIFQNLTMAPSSNPTTLCLCPVYITFPPHLPTPPPTFLVRLWFYVHHILTTTKW